jgi:hypothetical protein
MAEKTVAGGMMMPYGVAIGNALSKAATSTDELLALRDHARAIVDAQGDLVAALKTLDAEIDNRGAGKAASAPVERFVADRGGRAAGQGEGGDRTGHSESCYRRDREDRYRR